jgi:hypothetical protein
MDCKKIKELAPDYLLDALDGQNRMSLEEHLAACPDCRQAMESYKRVWAELGKIPQEEPSPVLQARFTAMLKAFRYEPDEAKFKESPADKLTEWLENWWPRRPAFQLGTAFVFLLFGLALGQMVQRGGSDSSEIAQLKKEIQETHQLVTLALLNEPSAGDRLRGVAMSSSVKDPDDRFLTVLLNTLNYDPNENVRLAAVDASASFTDRVWVRTELVTALARQTSPLVQISLINLLASIREKKAAEVFQAIVNDENYLEQVKNRARLGIEALG